MVGNFSSNAEFGEELELERESVFKWTPLPASRAVEKAETAVSRTYTDRSEQRPKWIDWLQLTALPWLKKSGGKTH